MVNRSRGLIAASCILMGLGCSTEHKASPGAVQDDCVREVRTIAELDSGPRDLGVIRWRCSTETLLKEVPMSRFSIDEEGRLLSFYPAFPPAQGVEEPPADVPLRFVCFNEDGRLAGWEAFESGLVPACSLKVTGDPPVYSCTNNSCQSPSSCVVVFEYNEQGTLKRIYCNCESTP